MKTKRLLKHLLTPPWLAARAFPAGVLEAIEQAIRNSESSHNGELQFVVEASLDLMPLLRGMTPRQRARQLFGGLGAWDTEANSGVLIYVQLVDRRIEIIADRGIAAKVAQLEWDAICHRMECAFAAGQYQQGALAAIAEITSLLAIHFPPGTSNPNELPDRPIVL